MKLHPKISGFSFIVHFQEGIVCIMRIVFRAPFPIQFAGLGSFAIVGPRHVQREWVSENSDTLFYEVRANGKLLDIAPAKKAPLSAVQVVLNGRGWLHLVHVYVFCGLLFSVYIKPGKGMLKSNATRTRSQL